MSRLSSNSQTLLLALLCAAIALFGTCSGGSGRHVKFTSVDLLLRGQQNNNDQQWSSSSADEDITTKQFNFLFAQKNALYRFVYNAQIASGQYQELQQQYGASSSQQKAVTRLQCVANIQFASERLAQLQLEQCRVGQLNEPMLVAAVQEMRPMGVFEQKKIPSPKKQLLEMPCQFNFVDGVVERVQFQDDDETWSKNIKRAVLNMIQMNLKRNNVQGLRTSEVRDEQDSQQQDQQMDAKQFRQGKTFSIPEITIEGQCQTVYTINEVGGPVGQQLYNVTKAINFKQCQKIADVAFGFQTQPPQFQCGQCHQYWAQQQIAHNNRPEASIVANAGYAQLQQTEQQPQLNPQQHPCTKCDPKEVKEHELDRSTVIRCQIQGQPTQQYALNSCELISHYVYRSVKSSSDSAANAAMHTVVSATLNPIDAKTQVAPIAAMSSAKQESLLYSNQWELDEKRFRMYGDEEFGSGKQQQSPYASVPKVHQAEQALRKLIQAMQADQKSAEGIEQEAPVQMQRLVDMMRMCTRAELKHIEQQVGSASAVQQKQQLAQIFVGALGTCGTCNCVAELALKFRQTQQQTIIGRPIVMQALLALQQLPAPSDCILAQVEQMCKSEAVHAQQAVKQACWLTFGALVNEACERQTRKNVLECSGAEPAEDNCWQSGFYSTGVCGMDKKQQYKQAMLNVYRSGNCIYDKVLALSALGNAGLNIAIGDLETIIRDTAEPPVVRCKAIDALRRLHSAQALRVQRILLPLYLNAREQPQVRVAAFGQLLFAQPEPAVVDQLMFSIANERNKLVQAFAYRTMKMLAKSRRPNEKQLAKHIKVALKLAKVDEQQLRSNSGKWQSQLLYNAAEQEGVFATLTSVVSERSELPAYLHVQLDTHLNDQLQINWAKLFMLQQGAEQWYRNVAKQFRSFFTAKQSASASSSIITRGQRFENGQRVTLSNMYDALGIKARRNFTRFNEDNDLGEVENKPVEQKFSKYQQHSQQFAMFALRIKDVDQAFLALDEHIIAEQTRQQLNGEQPFNIASLLFGTAQLKQLNIALAHNMHEQWAKLPTSVGVPLRILSSAPALASISGHVKPELASLNSRLISFNVKASTHFAHIQSMECWTPFVVSGVQYLRSLQLNAPMYGELSSDNGMRLKLQLPQQHTPLINLHTLPITFTAVIDAKSWLVREPRQMNTIHDPLLDRLQNEMNVFMGQKHLAMPFHIEGHFHCPSSPANFKELIQLLMNTENALLVSYVPSQDSPREISFRIAGSFFQPKTQLAELAKPDEQLHNFFAEQFDSPFICEEQQCAESGECDVQCNDGNEMEQEQDAQQIFNVRKQQLQAFISEYKPRKQYLHSLKLSVQTHGGAKDAKAICDIHAQCDPHTQYCSVQMNVERLPMGNSERQKWQLKVNAQVVFPERVSSVQQLLQQQQVTAQRKQMYARVVAMWGGAASAGKQQMDIRVQGMQAPQMRKIMQHPMLINSSVKQQRQFALRFNFLNKFHAVAEYTLQAPVQNAINRVLETLNSYYFWNTNSKPFSMPQPQQNGKMSAVVIIDPITQNLANITVKTPAQQVRMQQIRLPVRARPFPLISQQSVQQTHSLGQLISQLSIGSRAQCIVDGQRVNTFDDFQYWAPLSSHCYSVLAKDCGGTDQSQFAVLIKNKHGQNKQQSPITFGKKLKVVTPEQEIVCQPEAASVGQKKQQHPIVCTVNGQPMDINNIDDDAETFSNDASRSPRVRYNNAPQNSDVTINTEHIAVRFNGRKAWLKVSGGYKHEQCGLCGHYDDDADYEWLKADGQIASTLVDFHRSFALSDAEECTPQAMNDFYSEGSKLPGSFFSEFKRSNAKTYNMEYDAETEDDSENFEGQYGDDTWDVAPQSTDFSVYDPFATFSSNLISTGEEISCCCCCRSGDDQCARNCSSDIQCMQQCVQCQTPKKCCCCCADDDQQCRQNCQNSAACKQQCAQGMCEQCCCCCSAWDATCRQNCKNADECPQRCANGQCIPPKAASSGAEDSGENEDEDFELINPEWRTIVQEQSHAVCFSAKPVPQCPRGFYASRDSSEAENNGAAMADDEEDSSSGSSEEAATQAASGAAKKKVNFKCIERAEPLARRLMRQLRAGQLVIGVPEARGISYTEQVMEPRQCWRPRRFP